MTRVGVDVGGTFTDLVAVRPDGTLEIRKVASTPQDPSLGLLVPSTLWDGDGGGGRGSRLTVPVPRPPPH